DARAMAALSAALDDEDVELARMAAEALGRLGLRESGEALFSIMEKADDPILVDAARKSLAVLFKDDPGSSKSGWESWAKRNRMFRMR
ncbi:MAG: HEAT repeat domain-containing protein, partial [Planctomycetes bacterium]|nr:HEAT repeat domain-containing protein [Planctomycetota bacterium]